MQTFCEFLYNNHDLSFSKQQKLFHFAEDHQSREIIDFLKNSDYISEKKLLQLIASYYGLDLYKDLKIKLNRENSLYFDLAEVQEYKIILLKKDDNQVCFGTLYPPDLFLNEKIKFKFKMKVKFYLMSEEEFKEAEKTIYSNYFKVDQNEILKELPDFKKIDSRDIDSLKDIVEDAPVVKLLNKILTEAISLGASDIHLEKKEKLFKVRYRIDGILKSYYNLPVNIAAAVISRIKIISAMDITIRHLPQDGKMEFKFQNSDYDIRTSVIPTIYGEKAVLRLLLRNEELLTVEELNFCEYNLNRFKKLLEYKSGIVLLSGPTGSGKTTTLFSILNHIASEENNIITIENPVEYKLKLLNQIEINEAQGLSFPVVLKSILRQDPDIIMIGEIRDRETAEIAIRAAVTGHLVLSTIHTIDSVSAVYRLLEMGIAPYLISSTLNAVVAQRLLRKLCKNCREKTDGSFQAVGCSECADNGYLGRTAAAEVLLVNDKLRNLINNNAERSALKKAAVRSGMLTLYKSALKKIENGKSTKEELLRVIDLEN